MFDKTYEKIGVAGSHFSTHGHAITLLVVVTVISGRLPDGNRLIFPQTVVDAGYRKVRVIR